MPPLPSTGLNGPVIPPPAGGSVPPATPPAAAPTPAGGTTTAPLDPDVVALTKAIFQHESGTNFTKYGDNNTSYGAGQWNNGGKPLATGQTPANWQAAAKSILGDANAPMTPANQKAVAYAQIYQDKQNGLNPAQIAAKWNSGSPDGWENKIGTTTINGKQIEYNVPAYVKNVTDLYQQFKTGSGDPTASATGTPAPLSIADQRAALQAAGQPVSVNPNKAAPSFFGSLIRNIISPVVRGVNTVVEPVQKLVTGNDNPNEYNSYLGDVSGLGMKQGQTTGQRVKDVVGGLANLAADFVGGEGATGVAEAGLEGLAKQGLITGAKEGAITGALGGFGGAMQSDKGAVDTLKDTALSAAGGAATGGAFGAVAPVLGVAKNAVFGADTATGQQAAANLVKTNPAVAQRATAIQKLAVKYPSVAAVVEKAKAQGIDPIATLSTTDLLNGAVDSTGHINTRPAMDELNSYLKNGIPGVNNGVSPESIVSTALKQEGTTVPVKEVQAKLNQAVNQSSLTGTSKVTALNSVKREVAGLQLDADKDGNIPLSTIHQAKVNKYANVNYMNPEQGTADKLIAKTYKGIVENNTKSIDVQAANSQLAQHYATLNLLEKLNGKKVDGGKLGKYFAQTIGSIIGSHTVPIVGPILGAHIGGVVAGRQLAGALGSDVEGKIGSSGAFNKILDDVSAAKNAPASRTLAVQHLPSQYTNELPTIPFGRTPKPTTAGPVVTAESAPNVISPFGTRGTKPAIPVLKKK